MDMFTKCFTHFETIPRQRGTLWNPEFQAGKAVATSVTNAVKGTEIWM